MKTRKERNRMERAYYYWMALAEVGTKTREKIENYIGSIEEM